MKKILCLLLALLMLMPASALADAEYRIPGTVTRKHFDANIYWDGVGDQPEQVSLLAAAVIMDMEAALSDEGFNPDKVKDIVAFELAGFIYIDIYDDAYSWQVSPVGDDMFVMRTGKSAMMEDPLALARQLKANGVYGEYIYVTDGDIRSGMEKIAEMEGVFSSGDAVVYFRNAQDVGPFRCGLANFNYQETGAFIRPDGTIVSRPEWNYCRPFIESCNVGVVYSGPFSYGYPNGGLYGLVDSEGNAITPMEYTGVEICDGGVLALNKNGKYCYFDSATGEIHNLTGFDKAAWRYDNGLVPVYMGPMDEEGEPAGGKWGFADLQGNVVIPIEWDDVGWSWYDGYATATLNGKMGLINRAGELVIPCEWEELSVVDGYVLAKNGNDCCVMNPTGEILGRFSGEKVYLEDGGYVATYVEFVNDGALYTLDGTRVLKPEWSDIAVLDENTVRLCQKDTAGNKFFGIMNLSTGEWIQPLIWESIDGEYDGMRRVKRNGRYGYMDADFNEVIPARYEEAESFNGGYACVRLNGQWQIINKAGETVF